MKKLVVISCAVLSLVFTSTIALSANCAWWKNLDGLEQSSRNAVKFGYVMGVYSTIADLYGMLYTADEISVVKVKEFLATKESITVVATNVDVFCCKKQNIFVSIPYFLEMSLRLESGIIILKEANYEEEILRELLPVGSP